MTPEQKQQIEQIEKQMAAYDAYYPSDADLWPNALKQSIEATRCLLSLVKSQEAPQHIAPDPKKVEAGRKGGLRRQETWKRGVKKCETCGKLSADLNDHPCFIAADNAATSMRSACVEKVREYLTDCRDEERGIIEAIAAELESVSIQKQEAKQS